MTMTAGQFEDYTMPADTTVTYCLKELRAIINFADTVAEPISACFSTAGQPIVFSLRSSGCFEGALVMATMAHEPVKDRYVGRPAPVSNSQLNQSERLSEVSEPVSFRAPPRPPAQRSAPAIGRRAGGFLESTPVNAR